MGNVIIEIVLCILIPFLLLSGMQDRRSRHLSLAVCAGCVMCLVAFYLNTWLYHKLGCSEFYLTTTVAPFVEECAKFLPILLFEKFVSREQHPLLTFAFAVGMGFAIVENAYMLTQSVSSATVSWMLVRGIGTGLMHGMSTAIVGMGIYLASRNRKMLLTGNIATLFWAMMYHGAYNAMILTDRVRYFAIFIPLLSYAAVVAAMNKDQIKAFLEE